MNSPAAIKSRLEAGSATNPARLKRAFFISALNFNSSQRLGNEFPGCYASEERGILAQYM
jgi:hypothetical protein